MLRIVYLAAGVASLLLSALGAVLPLLPTVPFLILAAFCFGRGDPRIERWLLDHRRLGPEIRRWRERGAISRKAKIAATLGFLISIALGAFFAPLPWALLPPAVALIAGGWVWSRPED